MKQLRAELAITKKELIAKENTATIATDFIRKNFRRIRGLKPNATVTHSWHKYKNFADDRYAFTVLIATDAHVSLATLVAGYKQIKKMFKDCGEPELYWHGKGMILAIGFTMNSKRMEQLEDLFG